MPKKPKRYEYKINLGKDFNGNPIRKSFYSTRSKSDARKKGEEYKRNYEMELCLTGESCIRKVRFSEWAISCLETYKKPYVQPNTYNGTWLEPAQRHLIPHFGKMNIDEIRPIHIQNYINQLSKTYSPETVRKDYNVLNLIFQTAVDNQLCAKSPITKSIKLPKYETRIEKTAYTQEQYDIAFRFAADWENGLSIMLLLETGISRSELLGLRWEDLDIPQRCIRINQGMVVYHSSDQGKQVVETSKLKNKFRQRTIPITNDELWDRLCQAPRTIEVRGETVATEYIIHSPEGKAARPDNWSRRVFTRFMNELHEAHPDIPILSPHELRHTRATLWIAQGVDPYMAARLLGHSDLKMLTKIYDHTSEETLRNVLLRAGRKETPDKDEGGRMMCLPLFVTVCDP